MPCQYCLLYFWKQSESPSSTWQRNSLSFPPEDAEVVFSNVFVVWLRSKKGGVRSNVLTRTILTSKLMNKLSIHIFSFSWETHQTPTNFSEQETWGSNRERAATYSQKAWISTQHVTQILHCWHLCFLFLSFFKIADLTSEQAWWKLLYCSKQRWKGKVWSWTVKHHVRKMDISLSKQRKKW